MKEIPLTQGMFAMVDDSDYEELMKYKWYSKYDGNTFYAARNSVRQDKKQKTLRMHRLILGLTDKKILCDHINHNGLDNQKCNIRICTRAQNQYNKIPQGGASRYKGVSWHEKNGKWRADININKEQIYLGLFADELDAARAYDKKAKELFGEYAWLNFKEEN